MTSTDPFDGFPENIEDLPTSPVSTEPDEIRPLRKVSSLQAKREQKARMEEINQIADETDFDAVPPWTPQAASLASAGWHAEIRMGKRIWVHPDFGGWKGEDSAYYLETHRQKGPDHQ